MMVMIEGQILTNKNGYDYKVIETNGYETLFERCSDGERVLAYRTKIFEDGKIEWSSGKYQ